MSQLKKVGFEQYRKHTFVDYEQKRKKKAKKKRARTKILTKIKNILPFARKSVTTAEKRNVYKCKNVTTIE